MTRTALLLAILVALAGTAAPAQDYKPGEKLTLANCGRCHVVSPKNRHGGIGSTPSFAVLRTFPDWKTRMKAFWTLPPHIAFTQIEGITPPFTPARPPEVHPITLTLDQVARIVAYAETIKPADLGGSLKLH